MPTHHRPRLLKSKNLPPGTAGAASPGEPRHTKRRFWLPLAGIAGCSICAVAACTLLIPGLVLGAERGPAATPASTAAATANSSNDAVSASTGTLLTRLSWGTGEGQVGLEAPTEGLTRGPEAIAVATDGRLAILDSVNHRLVLLQANGTYWDDIPLSLTTPRFLAVTDKTLYVLDCDNDHRLVATDWQGALVQEWAVPEFPDAVTALLATDNGPCIEVAHDSVYLVEDETDTAGAASSASSSSAFSGSPSATFAMNTAQPQHQAEVLAVAAKTARSVATLKTLDGRPVAPHLSRTAKVRFNPGTGARVQLYEAAKDTLRSHKTHDLTARPAPSRVVEHLVSVDGDGSNGLIIGAKLVTQPQRSAGKPPVALMISKVSAAQMTSPTLEMGRDATRTLFLTDCSFAYLGQPYVVTPNGTIVQPLADAQGYSLFCYSFPTTEPSSAEVAQ